MPLRNANVRSKLIPPLLLAFAAAVAFAQFPAPNGNTVVETSPGRGVASTTRLVSAMVVAVDLPSRNLTVRRADGTVIGITVGREVRNLEQLQPGDVVNVAYIESLVLQLKKNGAADVTRTDTADLKQAPRGALPGGVAQQQTVVVADVLAVDGAAGTVTLRGPQQTVSLRIKDPAQLALIKVGDQVEATYTEAVAVAVDPAR